MYKKVNSKIISYNPATKEELGEVRITEPKEMIDIVSECRKAFNDWKCLSFIKRGEYLLRLADYLDSEKESIARLITLEMGRPLTESIPEVVKSARFLRYFASDAEKLLANEEISGVANKTVNLVFEPYGVVALIKPWNMSLQTPIWSIAPALMAGNAVVFKPSENTLLVAKELQKAFQVCADVMRPLRF